MSERVKGDRERQRENMVQMMAELSENVPLAGTYSIISLCQWNIWQSYEREKGDQERQRANTGEREIERERVCVCETAKEKRDIADLRSSLKLSLSVR